VVCTAGIRRQYFFYQSELNMRHKNALGMILIPTMSILVIMTILILTLMKSVYIYSKINTQFIRNGQEFDDFEAAASWLVIHFPKIAPPVCIFSETDPNLIVRLLSHGVGCKLNLSHQAYEYLVDDLGTYPCLKVVIDNRTLATHHWYITIKSTAPPEKMIQIRIAKPSVAVHCESLVSKRINVGITSWRYLSNVNSP
jgi:hypothetical protein